MMSLPIRPCLNHDCLHHAVCEHQEPNLCGVAVPDHPEEDGCSLAWAYPTAEYPTAGAPGPAKLRFTDFDLDELQTWVMWREQYPKPRYCVEWILSGSTTVEANSAKEARSIVLSMQVEELCNDANTRDISAVEEDLCGGGAE